MADIDAVVERTHQLLSQLLGNVGQPDEHRAWQFTRGSATIIVAVIQDDDTDESAVWVASPVANGVQKDPELLDTLNTMNFSMKFAVAYWQDGTVYVSTRLVGETLDYPELRKALSVVGEWADGVDDAIVQRFGSGQAQPYWPDPPPPGVIR
jgi:Putative bacterial sensory transduction regulator